MAEQFSIFDHRTALARSERPRRFAVVGIVCALAQNLVVIACDALGLHYLAGMFLAFAAVTPLGYLLHTSYTFAEERSWQAFYRFSAGVAAGIPLAFFLMILLCSGLHVPVPWAIVVATGILFIWNYLSARWAITKARPVRRA